MFISDHTSDGAMKYVWAFVFTFSLLACAGVNTSEVNNTSPNTSTESTANLSDTPRTPDPPKKTPQGYISSEVYQPEKYGGFIGDCASDENFSFYWDCMSENSGNNFQ
jgi:hypothetical protein